MFIFAKLRRLCDTFKFLNSLYSGFLPRNFCLFVVILQYVSLTIPRVVLIIQQAQAITTPCQPY